MSEFGGMTSQKSFKAAEPSDRTEIRVRKTNIYKPNVPDMKK
jgi:hypothetical protein